MNKKLKIIFIFFLILAISTFVIFRIIKNKSLSKEITQEINPTTGTIQTFISTTGTVLPKNRLEVKPPVGGRIESILVKEGEGVKVAQILAWMSSTERAALLDAAQGQSEEKLKYWKEAYKAIPLLSPIKGQVIVATTQPGQTVTTADPVIVLSDHLIVRAQVDETDIGKITLAQEALITLDAYPDTKINSSVEHIYYESKTINNVTIYEVDLLPTDIPAFFRSGMNATIDFKAESKENALLIPVNAVHKGKDASFVLLKQEGSSEAIKRAVELGLTDDKNFEVISGLDASDKIIINIKKYSLPKNNVGSNPFSPIGQGQKRKTN